MIARLRKTFSHAHRTEKPGIGGVTEGMQGVRPRRGGEGKGREGRGGEQKR